MKLIKFRVTNFRSVTDSGWIDAGDVTALIGTNEAGKTNLLLPLWKLNPAKDGLINLISDAPRKHYHIIKDEEEKPVFIEAYFELPLALQQQIADLTGVPIEDARIAWVSRALDGKYEVGFPEAVAVRSLPAEEIAAPLSQALQALQGLSTVTKGDETLKDTMIAAIEQALGEVEEHDEETSAPMLGHIKAQLATVDLKDASKRSTIVPRYGQLIDDIDELLASVSKVELSDDEEVRSLVISNLPAFVYYSNYGNLDSEIYLPHVIENMRRTGLGSREAAQARTLKVLFEFPSKIPVSTRQAGTGSGAGSGLSVTLKPRALSRRTWCRSTRSASNVAK